MVDLTANGMPVPVMVRSAREFDLPRVCDIYNYYVANSTVSFDEEPRPLSEWLAKFERLRELDLPFIVAVGPGGEVLGFALVHPWKTKSAYRFVVENSVYLHPEATGQGLGRQLLTELIDQTTDAGPTQIVAVISDQGAESSLRLHESLGFVETGRMRDVGYKFDRWLGIVTLQLPLAGWRRPDD